ncbi:MAG: hypothetical protein GXP27_08540, partial [Planctomycetes bacterium]|nr:hypothetical protein [Planctomycetota bacterium]
MRVIFLKLSGGLFAGTQDGKPACIDHERVYAFAKAISTAVQEEDIKLGVAVCGGNIYRGRDHARIRKLKTSVYAGDHMGLLATVINGVALTDVLVHECGMRAELFSEVASADVADRFLVRKAAEYWRSFDILVFTGTGAPAVGRSTDSVAAD